MITVTSLPKQFGEKVRYERKQAGLSQEQLAAKAESEKASSLEYAKTLERQLVELG